MVIGFRYSGFWKGGYFAGGWKRGLDGRLLFRRVRDFDVDFVVTKGRDLAVISLRQKSSAAKHRIVLEAASPILLLRRGSHSP